MIADRWDCPIARTGLVLRAVQDSDLRKAAKSRVDVCDPTNPPAGFEPMTSSLKG